MSHWKLVAIAIVVILAIVVVMQNTQSVETRLLFVTVEMPRAVLLFVTLAIGFVVGVLVGGKIVRKRTAKPTGG